MSLFSTRTLVTALLLAQSFALPAPESKPVQLEERNICNDGELAAKNPRAAFFRKVVDESNYSNHSRVPTPKDVPLKVGIIGGGAAGLYAAILLDSLGIDYDIHEVSGRIGGRIYTYHFDQEAWDKSTPADPAYYDYYDVGAMRFPPMPYMSRIIGNDSWSLIPYINARVAERDQVVKKHYIFRTDNTFRRFNGITSLLQDPNSASPARYDVPVFNSTFNTQSAYNVWKAQVSNMTTALSNNFDTGFNLLMKYDSMTVREFLLDQGFTNTEIDWMETINDATGHYDMYSMSQAVLEQWIFDSADIDNWSLINGGMDMLTKGMNLIVKNKPVLHNRVSDIKRNANGSLKIVVNGTKEYDYAHVISTVPLGALQAINMTELDLNYFENHAIRSLNYDPSTKIGFKFKSRWWENLATGPFKGGQSFTDLPIRRCVYPSYGVDVPGAPGTMIASYVWGQDASRLGSYMNPHNEKQQAPYQPESIDVMVDLTLRNLAELNGVSHEFLLSQFEGYHAYDWYGSAYSNGAFAIFGPGQFSSTLPWLMRPSADGHMHFAGEALSSGHAWIIGAVNSAWRTVFEILCTEGLEDKKKQFVEQWGVIDEVDMGCTSASHSERGPNNLTPWQHYNHPHFLRAAGLDQYSTENSSQRSQNHLGELTWWDSYQAMGPMFGWQGITTDSGDGSQLPDYQIPLDPQLEADELPRASSRDDSIAAPGALHTGREDVFLGMLGSIEPSQSPGPHDCRPSQTTTHRSPQESIPTTLDNPESIFSSTFPPRSTTSDLLATQPSAPATQRRNHSASGTKRKANGSPTTELDSIDEDDANAIKRQRNTVAARRYRQKGRDRIMELESALKVVEEERDKLKLQLARKEAEVDALREIMKK
ncbi:L-amino acid oxidase [Colletotrichum simmondsii]|uniref:L-amino acid oxidase n=1 Tax=Colletotrichum simmondsii TaxID=703756 RepID=A0A135T3Y2_9PEZI|nr:L-amino acid oxidase [Colletotrichum simmondsii]